MSLIPSVVVCTGLSEPVFTVMAMFKEGHYAFKPFLSLSTLVGLIIAFVDTRIQENLIKGGLYGRNAAGKRTHTRAVKGIDGDVKLNRALWVMAESMLQLAS